MLTAIQSMHVQKVYPDCRSEMADFLSRGVEVFVARQNECGADVPPFAIRVVEQPEFWIDCARSERAAKQLAKDLGLKVIKPKTL
ncbi:MAG: hypothetical protein K2X55_12320 [Burkholderiaceae bacterium]|nr:hypothetical protein [Burkholderiaceae bacterium]